MAVVIPKQFKNNFILLLTSFLSATFLSFTVTTSALTIIKLPLRCAYGDPCWPSDEEWDTFNKSIEGHLKRTYPPAAVCHVDNNQYDENACDIARKSWADPWWRSNQTGSYMAMLWENGNSQCYIETDKNASCDQGLVPVYSVAVENIDHIQASVNFARENHLYLVVKNTGHSHLGRSSGKGSFSIWTHKLKKREWMESFVPQNAPYGTAGVPAITLQAGVQWAEVYEDAAKHGRVVVGGSATDVGAAGGYILGGGHSPLAHSHGLAVDNLLQISIVTADGKHRTINEYTDSEFFWALRGGGGSNWGVVTSVTYRTYLEVDNALVHLINITSSTYDGQLAITNSTLSMLPAMTKAGLVGYGIFESGFQAIMTLFNGTNDEQIAANKTISILNESMTLNQDIDVQIMGFMMPSFYQYYKNFITDPNIAVNLISGSRLLPEKVLETKSADIAKLVVDNPNHPAGFNFIGRVPSNERPKTSVHTGWDESCAILSFDARWNDEIRYEEKQRLSAEMTQVTQQLAKIVGPDAGTYINEADPNEPDWKNAFWGKNYRKLLSIKRRIDPTFLFTCNRCVGSETEFWVSH